MNLSALFGHSFDVGRSRKNFHNFNVVSMVFFAIDLERNLSQKTPSFGFLNIKVRKIWFKNG